MWAQSLVDKAVCMCVCACVCVLCFCMCICVFVCVCMHACVCDHVCMHDIILYNGCHDNHSVAHTDTTLNLISIAGHDNQ